PDLLESIRARSKETAPRLDQIRTDVPSHVARAVDRALSRDPADRFPDLEHFARALTTQPSSQRSWRSRRWPIAAIGIVVIVAVAAGGMTIQRFVSDGDVGVRSFIVLADIDNRTSEPGFDHAI